MEEKKEKQYVSDNARLMEEWDWEKNEELGFDPQNITVGSNKKVWWRCRNGHEWQTGINQRTRGRGCPYCVGQKVIKGYNDLQTINPGVAKEWNYERNNGLTPSDVMPNSNKKAWWKCEKGHEWEAVIADRNLGRGCPICVGKRVLVGYNDLTTTHPNLIKEWDFEKNKNINPSEVGKGSEKKVWWLCKRGHSWNAAIYS